MSQFFNQSSWSDLNVLFLNFTFFFPIFVSFDGKKEKKWGEIILFSLNRQSGVCPALLPWEEHNRCTRRTNVKYLIILIDVRLLKCSVASLLLPTIPCPSSCSKNLKCLLPAKGGVPEHWSTVWQWHRPVTRLKPGSWTAFEPLWIDAWKYDFMLETQY